MDPQLEQIVQRMIDAGEPEDAIAEVIRSYQPQGSATGGFFNRLLEVGKAIPGAIKQTVTDPVGTIKGLHEAQMQQFDKAGEAYANGNYSEMVGYAGAGLLPGVGPAAASIGEDFGSGDRERVGRGVADAAMMALPVGRHAGAPIRRGVHQAAGAVADNATLGSLVSGGSMTSGVVRGLARATEKLTAPKAPKPVAGLDRNMANVSSGGGRGSRAAEIPDSVRALNDTGVDKYMPNVSPKTGTMPPEFYTPDEEVIYNATRPYSYGDFVEPKDILPSGMPVERTSPRVFDHREVSLSGSRPPREMPPVDDVGPMSMREQMTRGLNEDMHVADAADREWQSANPAMPRSVRAMSPRLDAKVENAVSNHQRRRRHGVAGFRNLPELPPGELDRISKVIAGIEARRGGE